MKRWLLALAMLLFSGIALAAININTATKEELDALPGIGPVKAQAIVDYRKAKGPFKSIEDLKKVDGIGDATFEKIKGDVSVSGASKGAKSAQAPAAKAADPKAMPAAAPAAKAPDPKAMPVAAHAAKAAAAKAVDPKAVAPAAKAADGKSKN